MLNNWNEARSSSAKADQPQAEMEPWNGWNRLSNLNVLNGAKRLNGLNVLSWPNFLGDLYLELLNS
jgi:hypothetical protein